MMKMPISRYDLFFTIGFASLVWGLAGWWWQIAAIVAGVVIMALSAWGACGERVDDGNTRKDA